MSKQKPKEPVLTGKAAWIARLKAGETVSFRGKGNSMVPRIKSGETCTYVPVTKPEDVWVGAMVFCKVGRYIFTHLVTAIKGDQYQISNNHGHVNGWITLEQIYGRVTKVGDQDVKEKR